MAHVNHEADNVDLSMDHADVPAAVTVSGPSQEVATPVAADMGVPFINSVVAIDLQPGPDECLYSSQSSVGDSSGSIFRICFLPIFKDVFESP